MTTLQLRFDSKLDYQLEAVQAVVDIFAGLSRSDAPSSADNDIVNCLDSAVDDEMKLRLSDGGNLKTV